MSVWQCPKCSMKMEHHDQNPEARTVFQDRQRGQSSSVWCMKCDRPMVQIDKPKKEAT